MMNKCAFVSIMLVITVTGLLFANSTPDVSNVQVSQRGDNSRFVDIYYNLSDIDGDACTVWVLASDNDGATWNVPAFTLIGTNSHGINVTPGTGKHIVWDAGQDIPGKVGSLKVRVQADDGNGDMSMVFVPAGSFKYQNSTWLQHESYFIGKYEVTCKQYCEFLNNADPDGSNYYVGHPEINRYGEPGNHSYTVTQGKDNYPVSHVSFYDAQAYAAWKSSATGLNYRLPTEQEWEKAAGWDPDLQKLWTYGYQSENISCYRLNYNNCYGGVLPVGSFDGTDGKYDSFSYYGCYDMGGNLREWTGSLYNVGNNLHRAIRGGSWNYGVGFCAVTYRTEYYTLYHHSHMGFRLVLDLN